MTEITIDGWACDNEDKESVESTGRLRDIFGDPFKDFREMQDAKKKNQWQEIEIDLNPEVNPLSPEGFDQTFQRVAEASKPRPKGIGEDWFRSLLRKGLQNAQANKERNALATASDPTGKQQHGDHKADGKLARTAKVAQDHKMKKQQALRELQKRLAAVNSKRPKDPTKVQAWSDRRQALVKKIAEKRESMRFSDKRVASLREERRGN